MKWNTDKGFKRVFLGLLCVCALATGFWACLTGPSDIGAAAAFRVLLAKCTLGVFAPDVSPAQEAIVWDIRLPRMLLGFLVGAGLGISGAALQGLFRNPLADPGLIGVSGGAAVGGVAAIIFGARLLWPEALLWVVPAFALAGALAATFLIYHLSRIGGRVQVATLLLTGIAVNAIAAAFIGLALTVYAGHSELRSVALWTLGSLGGASWPVVWGVLLPLIPAAAVLMYHRAALNAFLLGEAEAYHLGYDVHKVKRRIIAASAVAVGATVAACGIIGFIGLIVPHLVRLAAGPDHRLLLPASALLGASLLTLADIAARTLAAPAELQIGILTALIGGPFFLGLLLSMKNRLAL